MKLVTKEEAESKLAELIERGFVACLRPQRIQDLMGKAPDEFYYAIFLKAQPGEYERYLEECPYWKDDARL